MAKENDFDINEGTLAKQASKEANEKITQELDRKKRSVKSSLKKTLDEAGLSANFEEKDSSVIVEIPISADEDKEELVSKLLAEKLEKAKKEAELEAERKAQEEVALRQKELEDEALKRAEEKAKQEAEEKARLEMERRQKEEAERLEAERKAEEAKKAEEVKKAEEAKKKAAAKKADEERKTAEKAKKEALEKEHNELKKRQAEEKAKLAAKKAEEEKLAAEKAKADAKKAEEDKKKRAEDNAKREKAIKAKIEKSRSEKKKSEPKKPLVDPDKFIPNFKRKYLTEVRERLQKEFEYSSAMEIPRLTKITVSFGCSEDKDNKKYMDAAVKELEQITGQHVVRTKAHKSIANFKIRQGQEIGAMVTLRNDNMWYFLERLISIALPRVRDFRGVKPNAFDGRGNYSLGISEQIIFPEIDFDKIERISGFNVAFVTTAKSDKEGYALLKELGMPFAK